MSRSVRRAVLRSKGKRRVYREFSHAIRRIIELAGDGYSERAIAASVGVDESLVRTILGLRVPQDRGEGGS